MSDKSPQILLFWFAERPFAAQKANETKNWPHLEAVADFWKFFVAMDSALEMEEKMFNNHV